MKTPERSAALAKALASDTNDLPEDFAARVAALAETGKERSWSWNDFALTGAFFAMVGVCVAGWIGFGMPAPPFGDWLEPVGRMMTSQPWLIIASAGMALIQVLNFRRRAMT